MTPQEPRTEQGRWLLDHQGLINATGDLRGDSIDLRQSILTIETEAFRLGTEGLIIAFRRFAIRAYEQTPTEDDLRSILEEATVLAAALAEEGR
jgi:hypothetical protein